MLDQSEYILQQLFFHHADYVKFFPKYLKLNLLQLNKHFFSIVYPLIGPKVIYFRLKYGKRIDSFKGRMKIKKYLSLPSPSTLLHYYSQVGNDIMVKLAVQIGGAKVNELCASSSPLHFALTCAQEKTARVLIQLGAQVDKEAVNNAIAAELFGLVKEMVAKVEIPLNDILKRTEVKDKEIVQHLVDLGADVTTTFKVPASNSTLLISAVHNQSVEAIRELVKQGADVNQVADRGAPLHKSCEYGSIEVVRELLLLGANPNQVFGREATPLRQALHCSEVLVKSRIVKILLEAGADPTFSLSTGSSKNMKKELLAISRKVSSDTKGADLIPQLAWGAFLGDFTLVTDALQRGVDINAKLDECNATPLHMAVNGGNLDMVTKLVECGADVNATAKKFGTPFHVAMQQENLEMMTLLKNLNAKWQLPVMYQSDPVLTKLVAPSYAVAEGKLLALKHLVTLGWKVMDFPKDILEVAVAAERIELVDELIAMGVPPKLEGMVFNRNFPLRMLKPMLKHCTEEEKKNLMINAAYRGKVKIIRALVEAGVDVNARDSSDGKTPLHILVSEGDYTKSFRILANLGANIHATDNDGMTPLHHAQFRNKMKKGEEHVDSAIELLLLGGGIHAKDNRGRTPFFYFVSQRCKVSEGEEEEDEEAIITTTRQLLPFGPDLHTRNNSGWTVMHKVSKMAYSKAARMFVPMGVKVNVRTLDSDSTPSDLAADFEYSPDGKDEFIAFLIERERVEKEHAENDQ